MFDERLYRSDKQIPVDSENRIRIDDWELSDDVQSAVRALMEQVTDENSEKLTDLEGYRHDFLAANGFDIAGVDYQADIERFDRL